MGRRIALVGTASSGVAAPYDNLEWEIWGVSARADYVTRANRWFELHRLDGEPADWAKSWRDTMRGFTNDIPEVLMLYPEPDLAPNVVRYPQDRITERFGSYFMTSSFAWMTALAIDEMAPAGQMAEPGSEIGIFGVEMEYGTEYREQRAGFRHFIALAQQLGIKVGRLVNGGLIYEPTPYPLWQDDPLLQKITLRKEQTRERLSDLEAARVSNRTMMTENAAVIRLLENPDSAPDIEKLRKQQEQLRQSDAELAERIAACNAVVDEQQFFLDYLQP